MKALFIPLRGVWFEAFEDGTKDTELRQYGPRWNEGTCPPGRQVTLSRGYSGRRIYGTVLAFERRKDRTPEYLAIYGEQAGDMAAIRIVLGRGVGFELSPAHQQVANSLSTGLSTGSACKSFNS